MVEATGSESGLTSVAQTQQAPVAQSDADQLYPFFNHIFEDVDERLLYELAKQHNAEYLKFGAVPNPPFPISGVVTTRVVNDEPLRRPLIPIIAQNCDETENGINVWFVFLTGSPYTFITEKALRILGITDADKAVDGSYKILLQGVTIECRKSFGSFKEVNVLGIDAFFRFGASVSFQGDTFELGQVYD